MSFNIGFETMVHFLGVTHDSQQRKGSFHDHPVIPSSLFAEFYIVWHTFSTTKAPVSQHNALSIVFLKEIQEILIGTVHFVPNPTTDLTETVKNPAPFHAHTPPTFILALGPELLVGTAFSNREYQFDWVAVHHIQHTGLFQQQIG